MQLKINRLNHTGEGIAQIDGVITFIPKTIPDDIIEVDEKDIIQHKRYNQVLKHELIVPSRDRISPQCPYYNECGGCQIMNLSYEKQLEYKKEKVTNIFKKYLKIDIKPDIIPSSQYKYRNKITLQVKENVVGLYKENTNEIISIEKCLLVPDKLNDLISILNKLDLKNVTKIVLKILNQKIMIQLIGNIKKEEAIKYLSNDVASIYINDELIYGMEFLKEELLPYSFYISPDSFFQVNHKGTIALYDRIKEFLGKDNKKVLDLYCGTGTIGIYISKYCESVTGIEINKSAVKDAQKNIELNHIKNVKIIWGDVEKSLKKDKKYDAIIVDPPRTGLDKITKEKLLQIKPKKIVYVSCNPMTLARDIDILRKEYHIEKISLIDMFPNTYHVETIVLLTKKSN